MAWELMLSKAPIPPDNLHRMKGEAKNPCDAAAEYEEMLRDFFRLKIQEKPRFDLILLGIGADGHTASLFPETEALDEKRRLVVANYVPTLKVNRLTLTLSVFNNAALVMFLVAGESKARALRSVIHNTFDGRRLPAGMIDPQNGRVLWLIDRAAADLLEPCDSGSSEIHELPQGN
jgi:6-phosphogluconolactonase